MADWSTTSVPYFIADNDKIYFYIGKIGDGRVTQDLKCQAYMTKIAMLENVSQRQYIVF